MRVASRPLTSGERTLRCFFPFGPPRPALARKGALHKPNLTLSYKISFGLIPSYMWLAGRGGEGPEEGQLQRLIPESRGGRPQGHLAGHLRGVGPCAAPGAAGVGDDVQPGALAGVGAAAGALQGRDAGARGCAGPHQACHAGGGHWERGERPVRGWASAGGTCTPGMLPAVCPARLGTFAPIHPRSHPAAGLPRVSVSAHRGGAQEPGGVRTCCDPTAA